MTIETDMVLLRQQMTNLMTHINSQDAVTAQSIQAITNDVNNKHQEITMLIRDVVTQKVMKLVSMLV